MLVVGGATVDFARRSAAMLIIGIILVFVGLAYLCWLLFALAVHALPFFVGATAGVAAYHSGSGPIGAILVGSMASGVTLVIGQVALMLSRSSVIRAAVALLFAIPAGVAGYHAALGLALIAIPSEGWRHTLAVTAAIIIAATAWARMTLSGPPDARPGVAAGQTSPPPAPSRTTNG
jgi:hypothetical protein